MFASRSRKSIGSRLFPIYLAHMPSTFTQARGKTGSPLRADSVLSPSNQETFEAVLARLKTDASTLETWIDRFRQWLAAEVVKPLLKHVQSAHLVRINGQNLFGYTYLVSDKGAQGLKERPSMDSYSTLHTCQEGASILADSSLEKTAKRGLLMQGRPSA